MVGMRRAFFALVAVAGLVLGPAVAASAAPSSFSGGEGIEQNPANNWWFRVVQSGTPGILTIDDIYTQQGYRYVTQSDGWDEIQLGNHGGAFQGDCLTWNDGLTEYDAITCRGLVSQQFTWVNWDTQGGFANFENKYTHTCMQANDAEGEGAAIQNRACGSLNNTFWDWGALVVG